jgi:hypothetical protein
LWVKEANNTVSGGIMTEPIDLILPRIPNPEIKAILGHFSDFLDEIVNFSTHVIKWCTENIKEGDEHLPIVQTYRHIVELTDSTSLLIRESCVEPCKILLRAVFESLLNVEYILQSDTEVRGKDFIIFSRHHRLRILQRANPADDMYKEFMALKEKDNLLSPMRIPGIPDIAERIDAYCRIFAVPSYAESEKEYKRLKKKNKHAPRAWFNMHDGPGTIQELAYHLGRPAQYEILYRQWSDQAHGIDIIEGKVESERPGEISFYQMRMPREAQFLTTMASSLAMSAMLLFLKQYAKERLGDFGAWYKEIIRERYLSFAGKKFIEVA